MIQHLRSFNLRIALPTMLAVSVLSCATARAAEPDVETNTILVNLADIDVFSPAGRAVAENRIAAAAARACGMPELMNMSASEQFRTCRNEAVSVARNDLDLRIAALRPAEDAAATLASR